MKIKGYADPDGPCPDCCGHGECEMKIQIAGTRCCLCGELIGFNTEFWIVGVGRYAHFACKIPPPVLEADEPQITQKEGNLMSRFKKLFSWSLFTAFFLFVAVYAASGQAIPKDDATVTLQTNGGDNRDPHMHVVWTPKANGKSTSRQSYLNFDMSVYPSNLTAQQIQKATLVLYIEKVSSGQPGHVTVCQLSQAWSSDTITGNTQPTCVPNIAPYTFPVTQDQLDDGSFVTVDVTGIVQNWYAGQANYGFGLAAEPAITGQGNGISVVFDSIKDNGNGYPPQLQLVLQSQGPMGPQGAQGPQGLPGLAGVAGPAGATGAQGAAGPQGPIGLTGSVGPAGPQGPGGLNGADGAVGAVGPAGPAGVAGAVGAVGPIGSQGVAGPSGAVGATGATGAVGPQGPQGLPGSIGPVGLTGPAGAIGPAGPTGAAGATGAVGPVGTQGIAGAAGPAGVDGAVGPQGPAGLQGAAGAVGPQGPTGPSGHSSFQGVWSSSGSYQQGDIVSDAGGSGTQLLLALTATPPPGTEPLNDQGAGKDWFCLTSTTGNGECDAPISCMTTDTCSPPPITGSVTSGGGFSGGTYYVPVNAAITAVNTGNTSTSNPLAFPFPFTVNDTPYTITSITASFSGAVTYSQIAFFKNGSTPICTLSGPPTNWTATCNPTANNQFSATDVLTVAVGTNAGAINSASWTINGVGPSQTAP